MSVQTVLLDFSLESSRIGDELGQKAVFTKIEYLLKEHLVGSGSLVLAADLKVEGGALKVLTGKNGCTVSVRFFDQGLVTINIEYYKQDDMEPLLSFESSKLLESSIRMTLGSERTKLFPTIKRGYKFDVYLTSSARALETQLRKQICALKGQAYPPIKRTLFGRYFPSADERLLEYDIDNVLYEKNSLFQKIQIVHSKSLGNMLVLDELQNIAEADLIYTETLMQRGKENYEGSEIVILGGGDGALLYELLKEKPKFVWMLEIDEDVMKACNKYMKSVCGDVLETRKGDNYEIIVGDCLVTLKNFIAQGKKVDYVFGDLTDVPISETPSGEIWDFIMLILETSFKVVRPTGKFMTHANGASCPEALQMYEDQLTKLKPPVQFTKSSAFIPSFLEDWIFYQICVKKDANSA